MTKSPILSALWILMLTLAVTPQLVMTGVAWSNGGYSNDPANPDYGTHDWIAEHALDWLPYEEKWYIVNNIAAYLYGTELPDNNQASDGIGDTALHHVYFNLNKYMTDDPAARRAQEEYNNTYAKLIAKDDYGAAKNAGIMAHYIADMAVFAHVMGSGTDWGAEKHHSDYENYVNAYTSDYNSTFNIFLEFDGLYPVSAYDATVNLAFDTTFDIGEDLTALWMDRNYNWSSPTFEKRVGESLNLAVNYITDVLHTLYVNYLESEKIQPPPFEPPSTPTSPPSFLPVLPPITVPLWIIVAAATAIAVIILIVLTPKRPKQPKRKLVRLFRCNQPFSPHS